MAYDAKKLYQDCYIDINRFIDDVKRIDYTGHEHFREGLMKGFDICLNILKTKHDHLTIQHMGGDAE